MIASWFVIIFCVVAPCLALASSVSEPWQWMVLLPLLFWSNRPHGCLLRRHLAWKKATVVLVVAWCAGWLAEHPDSHGWGWLVPGALAFGWFLQDWCAPRRDPLLEGQRLPERRLLSGYLGGGLALLALAALGRSWVPLVPAIFLVKAWFYPEGEIWDEAENGAVRTGKDESEGLDADTQQRFLDVLRLLTGVSLLAGLLVLLATLVLRPDLRLVATGLLAFGTCLTVGLPVESQVLRELDARSKDQERACAPPA